MDSHLLFSDANLGEHFFKTSLDGRNTYIEAISHNTECIETLQILREREQLAEYLNLFDGLALSLNQHSIFCRFMIDFNIIISNLYSVKDNSEQMLFVRLLYIELFRFREKISKDNNHLMLFFKSQNIDNTEYVQKRRDFEKTYSDHITTIRHKISAHFEESYNYIHFEKVINSIPVLEISKMTENFISLMRLLSALYKNAYDYTHQIISTIATETSN